MTQEFQFNNTIINEIINFTISTFDLLYISGPKGANKTELVNSALDNNDGNFLTFKHLCFENSTIDDFLLNFYDSMRTFSQNDKIIFKKIETDNFQEKVSHYFKTIGCDCIVVVENFEKTDKNIEIINFLSHIAKYENVKLIIIARENSQNLFRFQRLKIKDLTINQMDKELFTGKLATLLGATRPKVEDDFYEITQGCELYLQMAIKYCSTTDTTIEHLVNEFKRKNNKDKTSFNDFILHKLISLTTSSSLNLFKTLCLFRQGINIEFIEKYNLANVLDLDFLIKNLLITYNGQEYYVKDYFKPFVINLFSIQEKIDYVKNIIKIYEEELTKSPKDRLIRISRESIRKEIDYFSLLLPSINTDKGKNNFTYFSLSNPSWHTTDSKTKLSEKFQKIKEKKDALNKEEKLPLPKRLTSNLIEEQKEKERNFIIELINSSRESTNQYKYKEAIKYLTEAKELDKNLEFEIEILMLIAKNYEKLNDFKEAIEIYSKALISAKEINDTRRFEIEYFIAKIEKNNFKTQQALEIFEKIVKDKECPQRLLAHAFLEIAEIYESNSNIHNAIICYQNSLSLSLGKNKKLACKLYYKLGLLYDENQDIENAIDCYKKNYQTSSEISENKYYSASLVNLAIIKAEQSKYNEAIEYLKLALDFDTEINDLENIYNEQKELAKLYSYFDIAKTDYYYQQAIRTAQDLKDNFKVILVYFEYGEYFYDRMDDVNALKYFYTARKLLNTKDDENYRRINSRIQDIQARMNKEEFNLIAEKYGI